MPANEEKLGDLIMELALKPPYDQHDKFPTSTVDAFIVLVQEHMPEATVEDIQKSGLAGGFFPPVEEIQAHRESQKRDSDHDQEAHDHSGPYNAAIDFINGFFTGKTDVPESLLETIFRGRVHHIDPRFSRTEYDALVKKIISSSEKSSEAKVTPRRAMKPLGEDVGAARFIFGLSTTYEEKVDNRVRERQKIVCKNLLPTYQLPPTGSDRSATLNNMRTTLSMAGLSFDDATLQADIACFRVTFLYYCGSDDIQNTVREMIASQHLSTIPLRYLLDDGYDTEESIGFSVKPRFGKEETAVAMDWIRTLTNEGKKETDMKTVNFLQNSPTYRQMTRDPVQKRHDVILSIIWPKFLAAEMIDRDEVIKALKAKGIKASESDLNNDISALRKVYAFYFGSDIERKDAKKRADGGEQVAGILRRLLKDGFDSLKKLEAGTAMAPPSGSTKTM